MRGFLIREAGDAALLLELDRAIDAGVNARAAGIASSMRSAGVPGVRDVVSTYCSVAVYFDPLIGDVERLRAALAQAAASDAIEPGGRTIDVPVVYGGLEGPDLDAVAAQAGLTPEAVVERHAGRTYRVFMLGFLPGFAYMGTVDQQIAAPRHSTPRLRVAAGSVGIAGRQTGVYPVDSPGGWQIIGRTPLTIFDAGRSPAALFAAGDSVRFVPVRGGSREQDPPYDRGSRSRVLGGSREQDPPDSQNGRRFATVMRAGLFTTVQDRGRWGHQSMGVPVAGAMDVLAHERANSAIGNTADAATLEVTLDGPELRFEDGATVAVSGADLSATLDDEDVPLDTSCVAVRGACLRFGLRRHGTRAYVAIGGGIDVEAILGSRATHVASRMGGLNGRALAAGDRLPLGSAPFGQPTRRPDGPRPAAEGGRRLRVLPGPQEEWFPPETLERLQRSRFQVSPQSNRMGYRLHGARLTPARTAEMISDATFTGAVQVPPSGEPILLMADRQTTGGYPQIAIVISADLPAAGQLAPGEWVEFELCDRAAAIAALHASRNV